MHNSAVTCSPDPMYIIAIGWLYVVSMLALTETSVIAGIATLLFYGLLPVSLLLWLGGTKARRRARLLADQPARQGDGTDTHTDQ